MRNTVVLGVLGNVGREILDVLSQSSLSKSFNIVACSKPESVGREVSCGDNVLKCKALSDIDLGSGDIVFGAVGSKDISLIVDRIVSSGAVLIDNSSCFRADKKVPLVIPEINPNDLVMYKNKMIIANPNCSTIQMLVPLHLLHEKFKIKRIVVSTYQSVSGAGKEAMDELFRHTKSFFEGFSTVTSKVFPKKIAFNCIPQVGSFLDNGQTTEEEKMDNETKRILDDSISVTATCVRVPVFHCHAESVNVEFDREIDMDIVKDCLYNTNGVLFIDRSEDGKYHTQIEAPKTDVVFVSRLRRDPTLPNAINMWIVADNLRKGAALNAVQIAELLVKENFFNYRG